ncbi:RNA polymerase subunit sigma-70 [Longispora sp. NPDC051575]|uniref:RNA polymerase subunit sigma-70 n=1 Tax=Longispora sp. NPDC051575 TaxID=3154943 RepID=UPI0034146E87
MAKIVFEDLVRAHRRELLLHCYRLLGSLTDAEDVLQEVLLAAWRGLDGFEHRSSTRTWLYRIATNRCLNALRDRRVPSSPTPPFTPPAPSRLGELTWLQPFPDVLLQGLPATDPGPEAHYTAREAVELAFITALQRVPPRQAAVLVLCDVLGYPTAETATMLGTTPTTVKGLLQRARASVDRARHGVSHPPAPGDDDVVRRFAAAYSADDIDTVVALLTDDVWLSMPPAPHEYLGVTAVAGFLRAGAAWRAGHRFQLQHTTANGQPALVCAFDDGRPAGLFVLTLADGHIRGLTRFLDERLLRYLHPVTNVRRP